jgi:hypothetical protein
MTNRLLDWWRNRPAFSGMKGDSRSANLQSVSFDDEGINQTDWRGSEHTPSRVNWAEVAKVVAYKRDCYAYDLICIAIADASDVIRIELDEHSEGYQALMDALPNQLPGCLAPNQWWERVAQPPFETSWTELYRREPA